MTGYKGEGVEVERRVLMETTLAKCVDIRETIRRGRAEQPPKQQHGKSREQHTTIRAASNSDSDSDSATQQEQQQQNARTEVQAATAREATRISQPRVHSCDYVPLHC